MLMPHSAAEHTIRHSRKTVAPADVLAGLDDAELDGLFKPRVQAELAVYTAAQTAKRNEYRRKQKVSAEGTAEDAPGGAGAPDEPAGAPAAGAGREALMGGEDGSTPGGAADERGVQAQLAAEMGGRREGPREEKRRRTAGGQAFAVGGPEGEEGEDVEDPERYGAENEEEDEEVGDDVSDGDASETGPRDHDEDELARMENVRPDEEGDSTEDDEDMQ